MLYVITYGTVPGLWTTSEADTLPIGPIVNVSKTLDQAHALQVAMEGS